MKARFATLGLVLGFAVARADDDPPPAPLEGTKQELQALAKDQAASKAGTQEGSLKDAMPRMQSPVPSGPALEMPQSGNSPAELKKKREAQKNWLLDGVTQLERESKLKDNAQSDREKSADRDSAETKLEPSDGDYFLKVYSEEQKKAEAEKSSRSDGKHKDGPAQNDPLAPFLQGWLAGSPVRGQFFDEFVKRSASPSGDGATARTATATVDNLPLASLPASDVQSGRATEGVQAPAKATNPYLQAFNLSEATSVPPVGQPSASMFAPVTKPLVPVVPDTSSAARTGDRKAPPSPFDDKRFFPQGKHF